MRVTDLEAEFLRAHLAGDAERAENLLNQQLKAHGEADALEPFAWTAFREAARGYFRSRGPTWTRGDVVLLVSRVRTAFYSEHPDMIDAVAAEEQICYALGGSQASPRDAVHMGVARMVFLKVFADLLEMDAAAIDELLADARRIVDEHFSGSPA